MRDYELPRRPPPQAPLWQRLKYQLELWSIATSAQPGAWHTLRLTCAILLPIFIILVVFGLPIALLFLGAGLVVGFFFSFFHLQSPTDSVAQAQMVIGLFFMLCGLGGLLMARRTQVRTDANPPRRGLALLISKAAITFWVGTLLYAIAAAQIAVPVYAYWFSILFWVVMGCFAFPSVPRVIFTFARRRLRRPAHWQY